MLLSSFPIFLELNSEVQENKRYLALPPFANCGAPHLLPVELIRLLIVVREMLVRTWSMAVRRLWVAIVL